MVEFKFFQQVKSAQVGKSKHLRSGNSQTADACPFVQTAEGQQHFAIFEPVEENLENAIDTTALPAILQKPVRKDKFAEADSVLQQDVWWKEYVSPAQASGGEGYVANWTSEVLVPSDGRQAGDPLPFRMTTDPYVGSILLSCLCISALILARSQHYLFLSFKEFFTVRRRENLFSDSSDARMQGKYFFSFVLCLALSVLMFNYQQIYFPKTVRDISPYLLLGGNLVCFGIAFLLRTVLYAFVNMIFFDRERNGKWLESYHLLTVVGGSVALLISLLVVFYELDFANWQILFFLSAIIVEIFLTFKTFRIFFEGRLGLVHLILYLCTLEFLPLLTLWKGMVWVTQELTKLV